MEYLLCQVITSSIQAMVRGLVMNIFQKAGKGILISLIKDGVANIKRINKMVKNQENHSLHIFNHTDGLHLFVAKLSPSFKSSIA